MTRHMKSGGRAVAAVLLTLSGGALADCPPGTFEYPPMSFEVASIVIKHEGVMGPLIPDPGQYARAGVDTALISESAPWLPPPGCTLPYEWSEIILIAPEPLPDEVLCANQYYQGHTWVLFPGVWLVEFPDVPFNVDAMAAIYAKLPEVESAEPNSIGCGWCCPPPTDWAYEEREEGVWRWTVTSLGPFCSTREWRFDVTDEGEVIKVCYADCDQSGAYDLFDFLCFVNQFNDGVAHADCSGDGGLDLFDFLCFVNEFNAGC